MKVVIRADASVTIGIGHLMRCLTLAEALQERGVEVIFVCREVAGNCCEFLLEKGFHVFRLPGEETFDAVQDVEQTAVVIGSKPEWLIVDHYGIGTEWERRLRPLVGRIMVIDDLADRHHDCDMLLDQNLFEDMQQRYDGLTPFGCRRFFGPRYALLRGEFIEARKTLRERNGVVQRILIFFGGSDPTNETEKALLAINQMDCRDIEIDVVVGSTNPRGEKICDICAAMPNVTFYCQVSNMAELMAHADLAIGAGGATTWERCFLGLPTLVVVVADNQAKPAQAAHNTGLAYLVGKSAELTVPLLTDAISQALRQSDALKEMMNHCLSFMGQRNAPVNDEILTCLYEVTDVP